MAKKLCKICGKEGYLYYPYCYEHLSKKENQKELSKENKSFDEMYKSNLKDNKEIATETINNIQNNVITINENNKSKCITCGKSTDGLLFCSQCYHKYKNKELLFKITNCSSVELLDESYEGRYTCKDGHIVKSKSERDIDNYLFEHNIIHAYEKELPYGASEKEVLHPDFCLQDYFGKGNHAYIEHWGYEENNIQYTQTKKFKIPKYKELGITLICTYEKTDAKDIESTLDRKLNKNYIKENQINFEQ